MKGAIVNKNGILVFEVVKKVKDISGNDIDRRYEFLVPVGAPYKEVYDVAVEIAKEIIEYAKEMKKNYEKEMKNKSEQDNPKEINTESPKSKKG